MKIEIASLEDAQELVEIYRYYVEKTAITFEYEVPSVEEFKQRMVHVYGKNIPIWLLKRMIKLSVMLMQVVLKIGPLMIGVLRHQFMLIMI